MSSFPPSAEALEPEAWTRGPIADLFSSYVAAAALSASYELGLLDKLARDGEAPFGGDAGDGLDAGVVRQLYLTLSWAGIVKIEPGGGVTRGAFFDAAYAARGYFYWLVRGCGQVFTAAPELAPRRHRAGNFYQRDMRAVAIGASLIGDTEVEGLFDKLLASLPVRKIVDLGCGSGSRLIRVAGNHEGVTGVGIDISPDAVRLAREAVTKAELTDRISIVQADARELEPTAPYSDADTVTCVFMGHDFWPYANCVRTLRRLRTAFPGARHLLLCDVTRTVSLGGKDMTIFTLGFESVHALMGVYLPTLDEWHRAFTASGWSCQAVHPIAAPPNGFLFELLPAPGS